MLLVAQSLKYIFKYKSQITCHFLYVSDIKLRPLLMVNNDRTKVDDH